MKHINKWPLQQQAAQASIKEWMKLHGYSVRLKGNTHNLPMHIQTNFDRVYITAQSYTLAYVSLATWRVGSVMLDWSHYKIIMMKHIPVH